MARLVVLFVVLVAAELAPAQKIDQNANGMSDIWELVYGASSLNWNGDADADGVSNGLESIAGTNPFDANSAPRIAAVAHTTTNFSVSLPCVLGKQYQLQSIPGLSRASLSNWMTEASVVARTGTVVTVSAPASAAPKFFRIAISDVDTDGDGVNDWEEYKLGLDPTKAASNNQLDGNGQPMNDYAYATSQLASQNVVAIAATDPAANQPDPGQSAANMGTYHRDAGRLSAEHDHGEPGIGRPGDRVCDRRRGSPGSAAVAYPARRREFEDDHADTARQHEPAGPRGGDAEGSAGHRLHRRRLQQCQRHHLSFPDALRHRPHRRLLHQLKLDLRQQRQLQPGQFEVHPRGHQY